MRRLEKQLPRYKGPTGTTLAWTDDGHPHTGTEQEMARLTSAVAGVQIAIVSFEPVTWSDSCLGAATPGEACTEAITPGWIVVLSDQDGVFAVHTDLLGARMRRGPIPTTWSDVDGSWAA